MGRKKIIYFSLLFILVVICTITYFSYAFLIKTEEHHGKLNIVTGTLKYGLTSENLTNNSITVGPGKTEFNLVLRSLNNIDSKYQLYYQAPTGVVVGYPDTNSSVGTIQANDQITVLLVINNTTSSNQTVTFGVEGGFTGNTLVLSQGTAITEKINMCNYVVGQEFTFDYTGGEQTFTPECEGDYKIELWGASGSVITTGKSQGKGAYTSGVTNLSYNDLLYIYVGGQSAYNGGGIGEQNGGGATDIRLTSDNLYSRIMVAAGGGGGFYTGCGSVTSIGDAGGLKGYDAGGNFSQCAIGAGAGHSTDFSGFGATQYSGGLTGAAGYDSYQVTMDGTFGQGGYKDTRSSGGGGGWYGGGHGRHPGSSHTGGGGGSSYISGYIGCLAVSGDNTTSLKDGCTTSSRTEYCSKSYTNYSFIDGAMIDGRGCNWSTGSATNCGSNQPQPDGTKTAGHTGNGYAKITYLGNPLKSQILEDNTIVTTAPTLTTTSAVANENGLYSMTTSNGFGGSGDTTYFFRGDVTNNVVEFAGFIWRIVRINEDGTVRLMLDDGINNNQTNYLFNNNSGSRNYIYYSNSGNYIKKTVNDWYAANITGANASKVAAGNYFCEAANVLWDNDYTYGVPYGSYTPNLSCVTDTNGKGYVNASVGLLTYDELVLAGAYPSKSNTTFYLYKGVNHNNDTWWWTMSPAGFHTSWSYAFAWSYDGTNMQKHGVPDPNMTARPVINLNADVQVIKDSTTGHYVVQ